jgi:hypothetical protein
VPGSLAVALAAALAASPGLGADDEAWWARAGLSLRATWEAGIPSAALLFDPAARAFAAERYLAPGDAGRWLSALLRASAGIEAADWLGFRLDLDSGVLREQRFPSPVIACFSQGSPSGVDAAGSGGCVGMLRFALPSTALGPAELTSNGRPVGDEASSTLFVRQAYADLAVGRAGFLHLRVGRQRLRVADGLVYDDWGLAADLDVDVGAIGPPLALGLSLLYPTRGWPARDQWANPVLAASIDWLPSLGESVGLWAAFARDDAGEVGQILRQGAVASDVVRLGTSAPGSADYVAASRRLAVLLASPPRGAATLGWAGVSGRLDVGARSEARFAAGAAFGSATSAVVRPGELPRAVEIPVSGWAASLRWTSQLGPVSVSPFFVWLSGDDPASEQEITGAAPQRYTGFLAVSPFLTALNLFFSGGIDEAYADRRAASSGVNSRGVLAPGAEVGWSPARGLGLALKAAFLWSDRVGPFGGRVYGPEVDLNVSWSPWPWLSLLAEADALAMGSFFPRPALAHRLILGIDISTP